MSVPDDHVSESGRPPLDPLVVSSLAELKWIVAAWSVHCVWVVGYSSLYGYGDVEAADALVAGVPSWVFWGVLLPWGGATLFTIWFALVKMQDHALPDASDEDDVTETACEARDG